MELSSPKPSSPGSGFALSEEEVHLPALPRYPPPPPSAASLSFLRLYHLGQNVLRLSFDCSSLPPPLITSLGSLVLDTFLNFR